MNAADFQPERVPRLTSPLPWQEVDGEVFAVTPDDGVLHSFNDVGSRVWTLIDGRTSLGKIARRLAEEYEVEPERLHCDLAEFFRTLLDRGLIEYVEG